MKVKVTVGELSVMGKPLLGLLDTKMPGDISYQVARLIKQLGNEVDTVEKAQVGIIQKHGGTQDKATGNWTLEPTNRHFPKALDELNKMMALEIELDIDPLVLPSSVELKPHTLLTLEKFLTVARRV